MLCSGPDLRVTSSMWHDNCTVMLFAVCAESPLPSPNDTVAQIKLSLILRIDVSVVGTVGTGSTLIFLISIFAAKTI